MNNKYGFYTLTCECDMSYNPEENDNCPNCHKEHMFHTKFEFSVDKFLETVYSLNENHDKALDVVFDAYWQIYDKFDVMNEIAGKIDVTKLDLSVLVGFLTQTFPYIKQVPNHMELVTKIEQKMRDAGETEERVENLLKGLRSTGNYWEDMEMLGAPAWLSGPKPID